MNNKEKIKEWLKKDIRKLTLDEYYKVLAYLAGGTFIVVFSFLIGALFTFNVDNIVKLLVPFGVLLSAGLASVSVMKSINNTNRIEKEKEEKKVKNTLDRLEYYLNQLDYNTKGYKKAFEAYELFIEKKENFEFQNVELLYNRTNHILKSIRTDSELIVTIENELIITILMTNELILDILKKITNNELKDETSSLNNIKTIYYELIKQIESQINNTLKTYSLNKLNYSESNS